jgi:hypothetical protein
LFGPPTIPVHDDRNVFWQLLQVQGFHVEALDRGL